MNIGNSQKLVTNKRVTLPFRIEFAHGHNSRQARNGRWVPNRPAFFCHAILGEQSVASFSVELCRVNDSDYAEWVQIECDGLLRELAKFGLASPQIISSTELAQDVKAYIAESVKFYAVPQTAGSAS